MKYTLIILFTILIISCGSTSNNKKPISDEIVKNNQSLLWKIEKEGHKTSYIFGTMHMIDKEFYDFTPHMKNIVNNSDAIIMEIGGQPNPLIAFQMMTLKNGVVEDYFTNKQLSDLLNFMDNELNVSPEQFHTTYSKMKPFFILQTITQSYFSKDAISYDLNIMQMAEEKNIPLLGFETMEQQLGFFDQIPDSAIAEMIMTSVYDFNKEKKNTIKLQSIYAKQKVDKLLPLMKDQSPEFMAFEDLFLNNRNKAWIPQIIEHTTLKKCFIAVGAAHLFDKNGVLELLKEKGFTVTAIKK